MIQQNHVETNRASQGVVRGDVEPSGARRSLSRRLAAYASLGAALIWTMGCSGPPDELDDPSEPVELGGARQAATFPPLASWIAV